MNSEEELKELKNKKYKLIQELTILNARILRLEEDVYK